MSARELPYSLAGNRQQGHEPVTPSPGVDRESDLPARIGAGDPLQPRGERMIHASLRVVPAAEKRKEVLRILRSLLGPTRVEPGCVSCRFYQDAEDEDALCYVEEWETEQDLQRHVQSDDYRKVLALMDLSGQPPEVRFYMVSKTFGIEYLTRTRSLVG